MIRGIHKVRAKGAVYYYAWRGGPRLHLSPGDPGFEAEYEAVCSQGRRRANKRTMRRPAGLKPSLQRAVRVAVENARRRAQQRGMPFALTEVDLFERLEKTGGRCELSGLPFDLEYGDSRAYAHNPYGISIDRMRNSGGYTKGNVRLVLTSLNFAINQWGLDAYVKVARSVLGRLAPPQEL